VPGDEIRPVTALFADIVGSTSLGERLSPGEVKALVGECISRMSGAVEEFGGTIQAYAGDGICAYFGVPAAHEDDPERAAGAALRILSVAQDYAGEVEAAWGIQGFDVRIGLNTGQTGVGLVGSTSPGTVALGDTTNVAARLESNAAPGTALVGPETARRLTSGFVLEPLGEFQLKGRTDPVSAWRLVGRRSREVDGPRTPLVGRTDEVTRLETMLDELRAGRGQILLVVGEAGIGKTRLLTEMRSRVAEHVTWLQGSAASYGSGSGGGAQIVRSWLGLQEAEAEVVARMRLKANLNSLLGDRTSEALPGLARLLGVKLDPLDATSGEEPGQELHHAIHAWVEALASRGPVVVVFDGLQWADPLTLELTEDLLALTDRSPTMLIASFRPDPSSPAWSFRTRVLVDYSHRAQELRLGPLSEEAARQFADLVLPSPESDDVSKRGLVLRSEGNPLFLEELARSMQETKMGDRSRTWSVSVRDILPSSLGSLMVARIDRLPEGPRRVVQAAAVVGREFPIAVVERVVESADMSDDLALLLRADLVREVRRYPRLECTFRHGLIQEAALETLTPERLRELNGHVAAAYEELYADSLEDHLETLAYHYYRSNDHRSALRYLELATDRAVARGDRPAAVDLLLRARKTAAKIGDEAVDTRLSQRLSELQSESEDYRD
jgi:class 3 adenylate cyclase/predicted ATPase